MSTDRYAWLDTSRPVADRARALLAELTLDEKVAQLGSTWPGAEEAAGDVAPMQETHLRAEPFAEAIRNGIGQITRPYGTSPIEPGLGAARLTELQRAVVAASRLGIPAIAHEECLTGVTAWTATVYPTPLAWGATFDPELIGRVGAAIGGDLRRLGVHQGLSPVLDVVRDYRWGRVEETIGEDPVLVGAIGTAYVRGIESAGVIATPKHFAGYSASRAARNHAPVSMGPRELRDVILPPFEQALAHARSVMNAYTDMDGVPAGADRSLLTGILRDEWGFEGTVVSDYWAIPFLASMHRIADDEAGAAAAALAAGLDVELPHTLAFAALPALLADGRVSQEMIDTAVLRVLHQKVELGLLDPEWSPVPASSRFELDSTANRALARSAAQQSVVLLHNDGVLPLASPASIAVIGPCADDAGCLFGCYSFPNHVMPHYPHLPIGVDAPTYLSALRTEFAGSTVLSRIGTSVSGGETTRIAAAVRAARQAEVAIVVVGDRSGMFGHGTSGEGCDAPDLRLPGAQQLLLDAVIATGTPTVVVVSSGRPYALGTAVDRAAAIVQVFFPGEEGAGALAAVLSGAVAPSGRLPVQIPADPGGQPGTYLTAPLGLRSDGISNLDPTPAFPFGHGLAYTTFEHAVVAATDEVDPQGEATVEVEVRNTGSRDGTDVVQLYSARSVAEVVQPVRRLIGFARVDVAAGVTAKVHFTIPAAALSYTGLDLERIVEPGASDLVVAASAGAAGIRVPLVITGARTVVAGASRVVSAELV